MATANIEVTKDWTQLASVGDGTVLATFRKMGTLEVALTSADTAPTVTKGHLLRPGDALTRLAFGDGYVWARCLPSGNVDSIDVEVTKS